MAKRVTDMIVVVLNDGETYSDARGCVVLEVPDDVEDVDTYVKENYRNGDGLFV
jgi:hypothetical protein